MIIYTFLPATVLVFLQELLSILISIINSHKFKLFSRTSGSIFFFYSLKKPMIYILKVNLNIISSQCLIGAKPLHMKSEYKTTANKKKHSSYICVSFSEANLILNLLERVFSWEGFKFICNWRNEKESIFLPTLFGSVTQNKGKQCQCCKELEHTHAERSSQTG